MTFPKFNTTANVSYEDGQKIGHLVGRGFYHYYQNNSEIKDKLKQEKVSNKKNQYKFKENSSNGGAFYEHLKNDCDDERVIGSFCETWYKRFWINKKRKGKRYKQRLALFCLAVKYHTNVYCGINTRGTIKEEQNNSDISPEEFLWLRNTLLPELANTELNLNFSRNIPKGQNEDNNFLQEDILSLKDVIYEENYSKAMQLYESLEKTISQENNKSNKAVLELYHAIIQRNHFSNNELAHELLLEQRLELRKIENNEYLELAYETLLNIKIDIGDYTYADSIADWFIDSANNKIENAWGLYKKAQVSMHKLDLTQTKTYIDKVKKLVAELSLFQEVNAVDISDLRTAISFMTGLILKVKGDAEESKKHFLKAHRNNTNNTISSGTILYELAESVVLNRNFESLEWQEYLQQARKYYADKKNTRSVLACYMLEINIRHLRGENEESITIIKNTLQEFSQSKYHDGVIGIIKKRIDYLNRKHEYESAIPLINKIKELAQTHKSKFAHNEYLKYYGFFELVSGNYKKGELLYIELISNYKALLFEKQSQAEKALILYEIAILYGNLSKKYDELTFLKKVANIYKQLNLKGKLSGILLDIVQVKIALGTSDNHVKKIKQISAMAAETYHYYTNVKALIIGSYYCQSAQDYTQAKNLLLDAERLVIKYHLNDYKRIVGQRLREVIMKEQYTLPLPHSFNKLIDILFSSVDVKMGHLVSKQLFRYWHFQYNNYLFSYLSQKASLKALYFANTTADVKSYSEILENLFDYFIVGSESLHTNMKYDTFIYPFDEDSEKLRNVISTNEEYELNEEYKKLHTLFLEKLNHGLRPNEPLRYTFRPIKNKHKQIELLISGYGKELPNLMYDFFLKKTQAEIQASHYLPIHVSKSTNANELNSDLILGIELGCIPVYINSHIQENVTIISQINITFPTNPIQESQNVKLKSEINKLFQITREDAQFMLNNLKMNLKNIDCEGNNFLCDATIYIVEFMYYLEKMVSPIIIIHPKRI